MCERVREGEYDDHRIFCCCCRCCCCLYFKKKVNYRVLL